VLIPVYYECQTVIPSEDALSATQGEFFYKHIGKTGYLVELTTPSGKKLFTCRKNVTLGNRHDCLSLGINAEAEADALKGKTATAWWFDQEIYPFITQARLVRLVVDGNELVSFAQTVDDAERSAKRSPWEAFWLLVFFVFIAYLIVFKSLRESRGHPGSTVRA